MYSGEMQMNSIEAMQNGRNAAPDHRRSELYRNSPVRANIIRHLPLCKSDRVLEIGSAGGAVTEYLQSRAGEVSSVPRGEKISRYREKRFELITVIDWFAEAAAAESESGGSMPGMESDPEKCYIGFLQTICQMLIPGGRIVIAAENRLGLKYFAGMREKYSGKFFYGIEGYAKDDILRTFSRKEWILLLEKAGLKNFRITYPFPDHIFTMQLFSDEFLPRREELLARSLNFDSDRMVLFDDERVMQSLLDNELFPEFSNSFLIEIEK